MHFGNHNYNPYMFYIKYVVMRIIQIIFFMKYYCTVWDTTYDSPMIWRKIRTTKTKLMGLSRETDTGLQDIISKYGEYSQHTWNFCQVNGNVQGVLPWSHDLLDKMAEGT